MDKQGTSDTHYHYFQKDLEVASLEVYMMGLDENDPSKIKNCCLHLITIFLPWEREMDDDFMEVYLN